jgi:hypothetical protein
LQRKSEAKNHRRRNLLRHPTTSKIEAIATRFLQILNKFSNKMKVFFYWRSRSNRDSKIIVLVTCWPLSVKKMIGNCRSGEAFGKSERCSRRDIPGRARCGNALVDRGGLWWREVVGGYGGGGRWWPLVPSSGHWWLGLDGGCWWVGVDGGYWWLVVTSGHWLSIPWSS